MIQMLFRSPLYLVTQRQAKISLFWVDYLHFKKPISMGFLNCFFFQLQEITDPHVFAGTLKLYLREMPTPLLTPYSRWITQCRYSEPLFFLCFVCFSNPTCPRCIGSVPCVPSYTLSSPSLRE